jgi:pimeloyl-ACP methyl ester carboxylesterase
MPSSTEPALLFLHGTISSTEGSFRALWGGDSEVDARAQLAQAYGDRIYGFEHRSLTDSPIANVLALVQSLPVGARLHLVSHSRGGMLGELLARANRIGQRSFHRGGHPAFSDAWPRTLAARASTRTPKTCGR